VGKKPEQFLIVNNRPLKPDVFSVAVRNAFGSLIFPNQKPQFVLSIQIEANQVDMNVHPRKVEARFKFQSILFAVILKTIKQALEKTNLKKIVELKRPSLESFLNPNQDQTNSQLSKPSFNPSIQASKSDLSPIEKIPYLNSNRDSYQRSIRPNEAGFSFEPSPHTNEDSLQPTDLQHFESKELFENSLKYIGQMKNSYLLFESQEGLTIIDQHAAHEKVKYFEIRNRIQNLQKLKQPLLQKEELSLSIQKVEVLKDCLPVFKKLGFDFEINDQGKVFLLAVPNDLVKFSPYKLLEGILDDFQNQNLKNLTELEDIAINYAACRSAIKFGQSMSPLEVDALIKSLDELKHEKYSCPHGRPSTIVIDTNELEKLFLRKK